MTLDLPLVSVVLPTYNRIAFLPEAVDSVLAQTYQHWELIVVDDGSTDETAAYLAHLSDARVRVVPGLHCGNRAQVRNQAVAAAHGTYVAFLDSDDSWIPTKLERQVADLRLRARRWGYGHHRWVDDAGRPLPTLGGRRWKVCDGWILRDVIAGDARIAMPTVIVERSLLTEIGGFDETFLTGEDYDAWVRLAAHAEAALIPEPLAAVRLHAGNVPHHSSIEAHENLARVYLRLALDPRFARHHRLCRRRYAVTCVGLAALYRKAGRPIRAITTAIVALHRAPLVPATWTALAKSLIHPLLPQRVLSVYHRFRAQPRHATAPHA